MKSAPLAIGLFACLYNLSFPYIAHGFFHGMPAIPPIFCGNDSYQTSDNPPSFPEEEWLLHSRPQDLGWSVEELKGSLDYAEDEGVAAMMVIDNGRLIAARGCTKGKWYVASVRKSLISAAYGKYVANGTIDLKATLAELDVSEKGALLSSQQSRATVSNILTSSSGICLPSAASGRLDCELGQEVEPGKAFAYNNWDFNVADTIFSQFTGRDFHKVFQEDIADPIEMEDYLWERDGRSQYIEESEHRAYPMDMTTRDLARFGLLMLRNGKWQQRQVVPQAWVAKSTSALLPTPKSESLHPGGYGHYWWVHDGGVLKKHGLPERLYFAAGSFGQFIFVLPDNGIVMVLRGNLLKQKIFGKVRYDVMDIVGKVLAAKVTE